MPLRFIEQSGISLDIFLRLNVDVLDGVYFASY